MQAHECTNQRFWAFPGDLLLRFEVVQIRNRKSKDETARNKGSWPGEKFLRRLKCFKLPDFAANDRQRAALLSDLSGNGVENLG
jgi:hypothetical protein